MLDDPAIGLARFQPEIARVADDARRADLRHFSTLEEDPKWLHIVARASLPIAIRITADARGTLAGMLRDCAPEEDDSTIPSMFPESEPASQPVLRINQQPTGLTVADMLFMMQTELGQRLDRLRRLGESADVLSVVGECDGALRKVRHGLDSIMRVIESGDLGGTCERDTTELEESLAVRRAYARARRYFVDRPTPTGSNLGEALRGAAGRLESLSEGGVSALLRVRDRLQLLDLKHRVHSWLRAGGTDALAGLRLWQDAAGFFHMIVQINRRQELMEHDAAVLRNVLRDLSATAISAKSASSMSARHLAVDPRLLRLQGLDDELDRLLVECGEVTPALLATLERLGERYGIHPRALPWEGVA